MAEHRYRLIIVDDEYQIRRGLSRVVDWHEIDAQIVGVASSGTQALQMIRELAPDVVISDICMEGMDGISLVRKATEIDPSIRFIFISGHDDFPYAQKALELGVCRYLLKPLVPEEVLKAVSEVLLDSEKQNQQSELYRRERLLDLSIGSLNVSANQEQNGQQKGQDNYLIKHACKIIEESFRDHEFSQRKLADRLGVNPCYISRLFKSEMGVTYNQYLLQIRMKEAKRLLRETTMRVATVAGCVGYSDPRYFSTQFKHQEGMTPLGYRNLAG